MHTIHSVFRPRLALRTGRFLYGFYLIQLSSVPRADLLPDQPYQVDPVLLFSKLNVTAALERFAYGKYHVSRQETFPKRRQLEFLQNAVQFSVKIPFLINANSVVAHQAILQMI